METGEETRAPVPAGLLLGALTTLPSGTGSCEYLVSGVPPSPTLDSAPCPPGWVCRPSAAFPARAGGRPPPRRPAATQEVAFSASASGARGEGEAQQGDTSGGPGRRAGWTVTAWAPRAAFQVVGCSRAGTELTAGGLRGPGKVPPSRPKPQPSLLQDGDRKEANRGMKTTVRSHVAPTSERGYCL